MLILTKIHLMIMSIGCTIIMDWQVIYSRVVEVNNRLVLISGTFKEPIIHNVLVINANNETDAEIIKEVIYNASSNYRQNRQRYSDFCSVC